MLRFFGKIILWLYLWPILVPIKLWGRGETGKIVAGLWAFLFMCILTVVVIDATLGGDSETASRTTETPTRRALMADTGTTKYKIAPAPTNTPGKTPTPTHSRKQTNTPSITPAPEHTDTPVATNTPGFLAPSFDQIMATRDNEAMTSSQKRAFYASLKGRRMVDWQGVALNALPFLGSYTAYVDMAGGKDTDVTFKVGRSEAPKFTKGRAITISGEIDQVVAVFGDFFIMLNDVTYELGQVGALPATSTPRPTRTPRPTATARPTSTPTLLPVPEATSVYREMEDAPPESEEPIAVLRPTDAPSPITTPHVDPSVRGLGVSRQAIKAQFEGAGVQFQRGEPVAGGYPRDIGSADDSLVQVELDGPDEDLIAVIVWVKAPENSPDAELSRRLKYLDLALTSTVPGWTEGSDWLQKSLADMVPKMKRDEFPADLIVDQGAARVTLSASKGKESDSRFASVFIAIESLSWLRKVEAQLTAEPAPTETPAIATPRPSPELASSTMANSNARLRGGPGTNYPILGQVKAGDALSVAARNAKGDWCQLASGVWIAASLVANAPVGLPVAAVIPTPPAAKPSPIPTAPAVRAAPAVPAQQCDPCYPDVCIPAVSYDLDCPEVPFCQFRVTCDPHRFDGDHDGIGCEKCR